MYSEESYHHIVPGHGIHDMKETLEETLFPCLDTTSLIDIGAQIGSGETSWDRGGESAEALVTMPRMIFIFMGEKRQFVMTFKDTEKIFHSHFTIGVINSMVG